MKILKCDRCGAEVELIHRLSPERKDHEGDEPSFGWWISREQHDMPFDHDPDEFWYKQVRENVYETYLSADLCAKCKEEFKKHVSDYEAESMIEINKLEKQAEEKKRLYINGFLEPPN